MKTKVKLLCIITLIFSLFSLTKLNQKSKIDFTFDNIEALASGEGNGKSCYDPGSVECSGWRVDRVIWNR